MAAAGRSFYVTWDNADTVKRLMDDIQADLKKESNRELRAAAKKIATETVIPEIRKTASASGVPIAPAMAATARAKSDRMVRVQIGGVKPKLSGFRSKARAKKNYAPTLAWGSEKGPYPGSTVNHYAVGPSESWWVRAGIKAALPGAVKGYKEALNTILAKGSRFR
jgi:hypothetical protein